MFEISENLLESLSADLSEDLLKIRKNTFLEKEIGKAFLVVAATSNREETTILQNFVTLIMSL